MSAALGLALGILRAHGLRMTGVDIAPTSRSARERTARSPSRDHETPCAAVHGADIETAPLDELSTPSSATIRSAIEDDAQVAASTGDVIRRDDLHPRGDSREEGSRRRRVGRSDARYETLESPSARDYLRTFWPTSLRGRRRFVTVNGLSADTLGRDAWRESPEVTTGLQKVSAGRRKSAEACPTADSRQTCGARQVETWNERVAHGRASRRAPRRETATPMAEGRGDTRRPSARHQDLDEAGNISREYGEPPLPATPPGESVRCL